MSQLRELSLDEDGITVEQLLSLAEMPDLERFDCNHLSNEEILRLDQLINEPRLRENARKGHLAGYAISETQVKKLGLRQPLRMDNADNVPIKAKDHWYPPLWLSEAWDKQPKPPASEEHKDWFPCSPEKAKD